MTSKKQTTHFGFQTIPWDEKEKKVKEVFQSVAPNYDRMNNILSFGIHHFWKRFTVELSFLRPGQNVLDLAGGTGDLSRLLKHKVKDNGQVILADINSAMLQHGRNRLLNEGLDINYVQANAQCLPFADNSFHCVSIGFGLRNVTDKEAALASIYRVCKPGGKLMVLEFSQPTLPGLKPLYDWYSFKLLPKFGKYFANDEGSYEYLAESIRMHPKQDELKKLIESAQFEDCHYYNLSGGIVALHIAYKY